MFFHPTRPWSKAEKVQTFMVFIRGFHEVVVQHMCRAFRQKNTYSDITACCPSFDLVFKTFGTG